METSVRLDNLAIAKKIIALHRHEVDLLVLVSHLGVTDDVLVAQATDGIDLILGGHSHTVLDEPIKVKDTRIVHAGSSAEYIGRYDPGIIMPIITTATSPSRVFPLTATVQYALWLVGLAIGVAVFLAPALWNGFPIVFFDTGGYVGRVIEMTLAPGRSFFYGLFHMSCMALGIGLAIVVLFAKVAVKKWRWSLTACALPPAATVAAAMILMPLLHLALIARDRIENQAAGETEKADNHHAHRQHRGRRSRHQPGLDELGQDGDHQADRRKSKTEGDRRKKGHRPLFLDKGKDSQKDTATVLISGEFAGRSRRAVLVGRDDFRDRHAQMQGMNGEFGFRLETGGERGKAFDIAPGKDPVAGQHVLQPETNSRTTGLARRIFAMSLRPSEKYMSNLKN